METPREIKEEIMRRTAVLREKSGLTQDEIADILGIGRGQYVKYEKIYKDRATTLPIHLIPRFCEVTKSSPAFFLTGREHPIIAAYQGLEPESKERLAVDQFLGLQKKTDAALTLEQRSFHETKGDHYEANNPRRGR